MFRHKRHLFFDLDDTVTMSRTPLEDELYSFYASLPYDIVIVSGAQVSQIRAQVRELPFYKLGQNGNEAVDPQGEVLWSEQLSDHHLDAIREHVSVLRTLYTCDVRDEDDLLEHRGAQASYSLIGHHEKLDKKKACDPDKQIRRTLLAQAPFEHEELEIKIGGTTCFDYFPKGRNKGYNVERLLAHEGWDRDACLYFGDALFPGGNDETVVGIIDTFPVAHHLHTYEVLKKHFT